MRFWLVRVASIALAVMAAFGIQWLASVQTLIDPRLFGLAGLYVTLAVSLNLINGITGQFSIGHAAFYQVGAYLAGYLSVRLYNSQPIAGPGWLILMLIVGAAGASLAGLIVGLPSLRLRGDYLAIVTLGFGEIIRIIVQNIEEVGGSYGLSVSPKISPIWLIWFLAITCIAMCRNLMKTAHGLPFLAVRDDEIASAAMGVNVTRIKVAAFVIGAAYAGGAGALYAHFDGFISPSQFSMEVSFLILTMVVIGGLGSIIGSAVAAVGLFFLPELLRKMGAVTGASLLAGAITLVMLVYLFRKIAERVHGSLGRRLLAYGSALVVGLVVKLALGMLASLVPVLQAASYEADRLRMLIYAASLIVVMLLRTNRETA